MNAPFIIMYMAVTNYMVSNSDDFTDRFQQSLQNENFVASQELREEQIATTDPDVAIDDNTEIPDTALEEASLDEIPTEENMDIAEVDEKQVFSDEGLEEENIDEMESFESEEIAKNDGTLEDSEIVLPDNSVLETEVSPATNEATDVVLEKEDQMAAEELIDLPKDLDSEADTSNVFATETTEEKIEETAEVKAENNESKDQITENLIAEALESDEVKEDAKEEIADNEDKTKKADIKQESDIFELDKDEFNIEELAVKDKGDVVEVDISKKEDKSDQKRAINTVEEIKEVEEKIAEEQEAEIVEAEPTDILDEILVVEKTEADLLKEKIEKLRAKRKPQLSYKTQINSPIINRREYEYENDHLDNIAFVEEYYQLLFAAIETQNLVALEAITKKIGINNDISVNGQPPVIFAVNQGDINVIRKILALNYSPDKKDDAGNAPIHLAIMYDRPDIATELINYGADLTITNGIFKRPMNIAYDIGNQYLIDILYKAGAYNVRARDKFDKFIQAN